MQKLHFEIEIKASKDKVWETMLTDATYREWTAEFNPTSYFVGDWSKGSEMKFLGEGGKDGMVAEIAENIEGSMISIQHLGMIKGGVEDRDSDQVRSWLPAFENYYFEVIDENTTRVKIEMDAAEAYMEMFSEMWPRALNKLKEICER